MTKPPRNHEIGVQNSREIRSARSQQRSRAVWEDIEFLAFRNRPRTAADYADILNAEGRPTPSGEGVWSKPLVQRYMTMFGSNAKKLLACYPERSGSALGYPAEVYAALRAEIARHNAVDETNGNWVAAIDIEPTPLQPIFHVTRGHGDFIERSSTTKLCCRFNEVDGDGNVALVEAECRPIDLTAFVYHQTAEARRLLVERYWLMLVERYDKTFRKLTDGWHL